MAFNKFGGKGFNKGGFNRGGGFRRFGGPREMHKAVCSECKKECEVPFKPREGSPVYCKDCFLKRKGITPINREETEEAEDMKESEDVEEESEDFEEEE